MGLFKRSQTQLEPSSSVQEATAQDARPRKSIFDLFSSQKSRVTEATLQVWRNLPGEIRHDPSMVCFQREDERWKGKKNVKKNTNFRCFTTFKTDSILAFCALIHFHVNVGQSTQITILIINVLFQFI